MQYATQNDYLLVTRDNRLIIKCIANGVPVAYFSQNSNQAYVVAVRQVIGVPKRIAKGAPIKTHTKAKNRTLWARIMQTLAKIGGN